MTRSRLLASIAAFGIGMTASAILMAGMAVKAAAQRGDLFPQMHWSTAR